jgi:heme a synthase
MDGREGFTLWQEPTSNYQPGFLSSAAAAAIHVTHRLGALAASCALLLAAIYALCSRGLCSMRLPAILVLSALALQLTIGISMVLRGFPLWLATAHNAGAAFTLLAVIALVYRAQDSSSVS